MKVRIVIPIRYGGTRMDARPLLDETGWPLIRHVFEQAKKVKGIDEIIVATDDLRVKTTVEAFGGKCFISDTLHRNGSERVAEVVQAYDPDDLVINLQGDEPEFEPEDIESLVALHLESEADITTAATKFDADGPRTGHLSPLDPNCVKVIILGRQYSQKANIDWGKAVYFSRSIIPYPFEDRGEVINPADYLLHSGIYIYSVATLKKFVTTSMGQLEAKEKLEQLRAIENEMKVVVGMQSSLSHKINTVEDYK
ncbi:MAG: 3-deoxy-manno-octulosonate cytidylyltransferase, partial [Kangiellaceae bacterium]|nr:3-deoxy-manno-octulosonate cytidylyltransferase [Kangiellaceae bacterium]